MKNLALSLAALCAALLIRFFDSGEAIPVMGGTHHLESPSFTLSDLADDIFERSKHRG